MTGSVVVVVLSCAGGVVCSVGVSVGVVVVDSVVVSLLLQPITNTVKTVTKARNKFFMMIF